MLSKAPDAGDDGSSARKWRALALLMVIALFNYVDRQALAILQVPIKHDLGLTDTQLGALTGLAFAAVYSTLALPIARLADRWARKLIITLSLVIWSLMTACSGFAGGFLSLAACRMGVAFGEAGLVPATHAIIADTFPRHQRASALAIWCLAIPSGTMLGLVAGGWLAEALGWRRAFGTLGVIGIGLAPLVVWLLREPRRGATDPVGPAVETLSAWAALRLLWNLRTFRHSAWGGALLAYTMYAMLNWNAPFYNRLFGVPLGRLSLYLAILSGMGGAVGTLISGLLTDRLGRRDARWYVWGPGLAAITTVPFLLIAYTTGDLRVSLAAGTVSAICVNAFLAPAVATGQLLVPASLRAFTSSVLVLVVNIVGLGLGPFVTGVLSDALRTRFAMGQESLRYAILSASLAALLSSFHFLRAGRHLRREMAARHPSRQEEALKKYGNQLEGKIA